MDNTLLQDLRTANQAITRFVSERSVKTGPSRARLHSVHLGDLKRQLNTIERALGSVTPPGMRAAELDRELTTYAVNLAMLKKAIEELGPSLEEEMRLVKASIARLGAASDWSKSLKILSK